MGKKFLGIRRRGYAPFAYQERIVRDSESVGWLMRDHNERYNVFGSYFGYKIQHFLAKPWAKSREGLIKQQHRLRTEQSSCQSDSLALTAGQLAWHPVAKSA